MRYRKRRNKKRRYKKSRFKRMAKSQLGHGRFF